MEVKAKYVYAIRHNKTGRMYVGCSQHIQGRFRNHMNQLKNRKHKSAEMQKDFDEYGADFSVIELEKTVDCRVHLGNRYFPLYMLEELKWMRRLGTVENGYNKQDRMARKQLEMGIDRL